jgi:ABC-type lipoprotein release transport system permease subunit
MRWIDYLRLGWDQLKRRKVVTALCAAGIAIGSASIIVALAFGESVTHYSQERMSYYMKTDEITVRDGHPPEGGTAGPDDARQYKLTKAKIEMMKQLPHVKGIATYQTLNNFEFQIDDGKIGHIYNMYATELNTLSDFGYELVQGAASEQENTIILSYGATMGLFDEQASRKRSIELRRNAGAGGASADSGYIPPYLIPYPTYQKQIILKPAGSRPNDAASKLRFPVRVVGILKKPDGIPDDAVSNMKTAFIPPGLGQKIQRAINQANSDSNVRMPESEYNEVKIKVDQSSNVAQVDQWIRKLKLSSETNLHREEQMKQEFVIVRLVFGGIGLFVLFVASISIVVAMTMSIYQRRRQIGIMKVLGANLKQIRNMFIVESTLLGFLGGMLGILLSYWVIWGINIAIIQFSRSRPGEGQDFLFISTWILPVGLFFALLTGVLSGIYPAVKASKTDALTAIKRE